MSKEKTIKIYIENGAVIDVINIPPNYSCEVIDYDIEKEHDKGFVTDEDYEAMRRYIIKK